FLGLHARDVCRPCAALCDGRGTAGNVRRARQVADRALRTPACGDFGSGVAGAGGCLSLPVTAQQGGTLCPTFTSCRWISRRPTRPTSTVSTTPNTYRCCPRSPGCAT